MAGDKSAPYCKPAFHICKAVNGNVLTLMGTENTVVKNYYPNAWPLAFWMAISGFHSDCIIEIELQNQEGDIFWRDGSTQRYSFPNPLHTLELSWGLNPVFPSPGSFYFVLNANGFEIARQPFHSRLSETAPSPPDCAPLITVNPIKSGMNRRGANKPIPVCKPAFHICKEINGNVLTLIGNNNSVVTPNYPFGQPLNFWAAISGAKGNCKMEIELQDPAGEVFWRDGPARVLTFNGPLHTIHWSVSLTPVFPRPGDYFLVLTANGAEIARQPFFARVPQTATP